MNYCLHICAFVTSATQHFPSKIVVAQLVNRFLGCIVIRQSSASGLIHHISLYAYLFLQQVPLAAWLLPCTE